MANLGSDFRSTQPTDNDFVRHPSLPNLASELRSVKTRIKSFFERSFLVDTGDLWDLSVPIAALKSITPDPSGTWKRVTVNSKGQIIRGSNANTDDAPRIFRAVMYGQASTPSFMDTLSGVTEMVPEVEATPSTEFDKAFYATENFSFYKYSFVVPQKVYRIKATLVGYGLKYPDTTPYVAARQRDVSFSTTPGSILKIWVGNTSGTPSRIANATQSKYADSGAVVYPTGVDFPDVTVGYHSPYFVGYGTSGTVSSTEGGPGVVILEWYA